MTVGKSHGVRRPFAWPLGPNATFRGRIGFPPGKQAPWPCKVPCFLGPIATRVCSGAVKHVLPATLGGRSAVFSRSDCASGRGGCPGDLKEAPGVVGGRPEAAGRVAVDPAGKIRGFRGPGAPKHSKFAYKSGGREGGSIGSDVRLRIRTPTFSSRGGVLSRHFSSLSLLPCLRLLVLPLRRPVLFRFVANRRLHARAREASCTTSAKGVLRRRPMTCPGRSHAPSDTRTTADKSKVLTVTRGAAGKSHTQDASRACAFQPAAATPA